MRLRGASGRKLLSRNSVRCRCRHEPKWPCAEIAHAVHACGMDVRLVSEHCFPPDVRLFFCSQNDRGDSHRSTKSAAVWPKLWVATVLICGVFANVRVVSLLALRQ